MKKSIPWLLIAIVFSLLLLQYFFTAQTDTKIVLGEFLCIVWLSALNIATDTRPYTINKIFWIFNLFFFGIMPAYQFVAHAFPWYQQFDTTTCFLTNNLIISCLLAYMLMRIILKKISRKNENTQNYFSEDFLKNYKWLGTAIFIVACASVVWAIGFDHLWLRRLTRDSELRMNSTLQLVFDKTIRGAILYFTLLTIWLYRNKKISLSRLLLVLAGCIIVNFPASLPRYFTATLYGSIIVSFNTKWLNRKNSFSLLLSGLLLVAFPLFSITRYTIKEAKYRLVHPTQIIKETFTYGEFDPYATICRTMNFVEKNGNTHGKQLAGVLLFFVPRSIWPDKPVGSGMLIYLDYSVLGKEFRNIASSLYAEGFVNFGWAGSIIFVMLFATFIFFYDNFFWSKAKNTEQLLYLSLFYPVALFMAFYMMRGDLLSSFAFTAGFFVSGLIFHNLLLRLFKKK